VKCPHRISVTCKKCLWERLHAAEGNYDTATEAWNAEIKLRQRAEHAHAAAVLEMGRLRARILAIDTSKTIGASQVEQLQHELRAGE
jgi:hypothetical protein